MKTKSLATAVALNALLFSTAMAAVAGREVLHF